MIVKHLFAHWRAMLTEYSLLRWVLCVVRSLRVLFYWRGHRELFGLPVYRDYVLGEHNLDPFYHLSHRYYLMQGLSASQRLAFMLDHYRFEDQTFSTLYKHDVYCGDGLRLWQKDAGGAVFDMVLTYGNRADAEGDLTLTLRVDGARLHRVSFSWMTERGRSIPFIGRNQGHCLAEDWQFQRFCDAYPNNSPSYFCYAALQGIAMAVGAPYMMAVSSVRQVSARHGKGKRYLNAYDGFWEKIGGERSQQALYWLPVPIPIRPLAEKSAKHRKRSAQRRVNWAAISGAVHTALSAHIVVPSDSTCTHFASTKIELGNMVLL